MTASARLHSAHFAWIKEMSVALHRRAAYPPGHPTRRAGDTAVFDALTRVLEVIPQITLTVTENQLGVDGGFSDPKSPALSDLAEKLHRRRIAVVTLRRGLGPEELDGLLSRVLPAESAAAADAVAGTVDERVDDPGPHCIVEYLSFEALELDDEEAGMAADLHGDRLWRDLADFAKRGWHPGGSPADAGGLGQSGESDESGELRDAARAITAPDVAASIAAAAADPARAAPVLDTLFRMGRHARKLGRAGNGATAQRLREVIKTLPEGTLRSLLDSEMDPRRRAQLLAQGVDAMPISCVLDFVEAAAQSSGQHVSQHLLRLFSKLSQHTRRRRDQKGDDGGEAIRSAARELVQGWSLHDTNPEPHSALLEQLSRYEKTGRPLDGGEAAGADRILKMALELNARGPDIVAAADQLVESGRLSVLLSIIERAPHAGGTGDVLSEYVTSPDLVRRILLTEPIERDTVAALLARADARIADALLDALAISESMATRQLILARLSELHEAVRPRVLGRLDAGAGWQVSRNLLYLLAQSPTPPTDVPLEPFLRHPEANVRLEVLRLRVRLDHAREAALLEAIADSDPRVVRTALDLARGDVPRRLAPRLLAMLQAAERGSEMRLKGIPLLAAHPSTAARDFLLALVMRKRALFRRTALQPKSPELLAALRALASGWPRDATCTSAFTLANADADLSVRGAVRPLSGGVP